MDHKKGNSYVNFILMVIVMIFVITLFTNLFFSLRFFSLRENCKDSVFLESVGSKLDVTGKTAIKHVCPKMDLTFSDKKTIIQDTKTNLDKKEPEAENAEDYYHYIAEEMTLCWWQFLEGRTDIFDDEDTFTFNSEKVCYICDNVIFEKKNIPLLTYSDLNRYLRNSKSDDYGNYWTFLSSSTQSEINYEDFINKIIGNNNNNNNINPKMNYQIVFVKSDNAKIKFLDFSEKLYGVYLMPTNLVNQQCEGNLV